jgi:oxygen-independent coproporphyrinogen-3 oxidase
VECLKTEIAMRINYLPEDPVNTLYIGGGTPSLLRSGEMEGIFSAISSHFKLSEHMEFTLEANPDDITPDYLDSLKNLGVNRLSIGIQTFNPLVLKWMNRAHTVEQALNSVAMAKEAGFQNINIDLIYAVPLEDYSLRDDLSGIIDLKPAHVSAYNLTIEPATVFGRRLKRGLMKEVSEETAASNFQLVMDTLRSAGYRHYEISNFSIPGKESRHNLGYWSGQPYLGIGPSAHSFNGFTRQYNIANNGQYMRAIKSNSLPCTVEELSPEERINEMIMLNLRTCEGLELHLKTDGLEWQLDFHHENYLDNLVQHEYAIIKKNRLILTDKGKQVADRIAEDLFIVD